MTTTKLSRQEKKEKSLQWVTDQVNSLTSEFKDKLNRGIPLGIVLDSVRESIASIQSKEPGRIEQLRKVRLSVSAKIVSRVGLESLSSEDQNRVLDGTLLNPPAPKMDPEREVWRNRKDVHADDKAEKKRFTKERSGQDAPIDKNWSLGGRGVDGLRRMRM